MESNFVADTKAAYGFRIAAAVVDDANEDTERRDYGGYVVYSNDTTFVVIGLDRGVVLYPRIGRTKDKGKHKQIGELSLRLICEYFGASADVRRLLTSLDPDEYRRGLAELAEQGPGLGRSNESFSRNALASSTTANLARNAELLERCGKPFLMGEFSDWLPLHEYRLNRAIAKELASAELQGKDQSVEEIKARFHRSAEYIEELESETEDPS